MTDQTPRIVVGCDGSPESEHALAWAAKYAGETGAALSLVNAWQWPTVQSVPITLDRDSDPRVWGTDLLNRLRGTLQIPDDRVSADVLHGNPASVLIERAEHADLLVVGSHGLGAFSRLLLGSVSARCATHAPCPVAVVRHSSRSVPNRVVVGVDESPAALVALRWAMDYADLVHWPLSVVHAIEIPAPPIPFEYHVEVDMPRARMHLDVRSWLKELVAKVEADRDRSLRRGVSYHVIEGNPGHVLVRQSEHASIVVVGRRGAGGFGRLVMGSAAAALAHHGASTCVITPSPPKG